MKFCGRLLAVAAVLIWTSQAIAQPPSGTMGPPSRGDDREGRSRDRSRGSGGGDRGSRDGYRSRGGPGGDFRGRGGGDRGGPGGDYRGRGGPSFGGDRGPGDSFRGPGGPPMGGYRGPGGPGDDERASRLEGMLRGLDTNGNGVIEPGEVPEERKRMLEFMARRAGIEIDGPIKIEKIRDAMLGRTSSGDGDSKSRARNRSRWCPGSGRIRNWPACPGSANGSRRRPVAVRPGGRLDHLRPETRPDGGPPRVPDRIENRKNA